jgi:hypothetical protein
MAARVTRLLVALGLLLGAMVAPAAAAARRVSTTLRHLAREFTDVSPLSGRPPDAAC